MIYLLPINLLVKIKGLMKKIFSVNDALRWAGRHLSINNIPDPAMDAEYLLAHVIGCQRKDLLIHPEKIISESEMNRFREFVERRRKREPVQYITGEVEFRGLIFRVNKDVLIPRPETELLVEEVINSVKEKSESKGGRDVTILDLCTGSGCIAISIAKELPYCRVYAVDISEKALDKAIENAERFGVGDRVIFSQGDLYEAIEHMGLDGEIDIIVSNPPYVSEKDMEQLQPEIKDYEPAQSLYGGENGLDYYRRIIEDAACYLSNNGLLIMELGFGQADNVKDLLEQAGVFSNIEIKKDLAGIDRVIKAAFTPD